MCIENYIIDGVSNLSWEELEDCLSESDEMMDKLNEELSSSSGMDIYSIESKISELESFISDVKYRLQ